MKFSAIMSKAADDLQEFDPPVGTWVGILRRGKFTEPKADKNGRDFVKANIAIELKTPGEDVDPIAAEKVAPMLANNRVFYSSDLFYDGDEDKPAKFIKLLRNCGAQTAGRTPEEVLKDGIDGVEVMVEVKKESFRGRDGSDREETRATKIYPTVE